LNAGKIKTRLSDLILYFQNDLGDRFFQSDFFSELLKKVQVDSSHFEFKQGEKSLMLVVKGFGGVRASMEQLLNLG
jgi:hypothetical protein